MTNPAAYEESKERAFSLPLNTSLRTLHSFNDTIIRYTMIIKLKTLLHLLMYVAGHMPGVPNFCVKPRKKNI
jgi:hypothetical protein